MKVTNINNTDAPKRDNRVLWLRLVITILGFVIISFGLAYLFQSFITKFNFPLYDFAWLAYLVVFGLSLLANLSVIVGIPFAASIMIAAATKWNPVLIALFGSIGGTIGELSGYYAGYIGKKIAIRGEVMGYRRVEHWIQRWGIWAISLLAFQPVIPFDIGGFIAGTVRMPLRKFLPALWLGKFPKYVILTYVGIELINLLPPFFFP